MGLVTVLLPSNMVVMTVVVVFKMVMVWGVLIIDGIWVRRQLSE